MSLTVGNVSRTRRTKIIDEFQQRQAGQFEQNEIKMNIQNDLQDQQSQIYVSEMDSVMLTNQQFSVGDITENLDSVYSPDNQIQNKKQMTKTLKHANHRLIRYTVKKDKDVKKKKQKNRGKKFTLEEDQRLLAFIQKKGPKFHKFSRYFPGKSTNMLKNRYYKSLRFKSDLAQPSEYESMNDYIDPYYSDIEEEQNVPMFSEIVSLKLFSEAEDILSNFVGSLSYTFQTMQANFLLEND